MLYTGLLTSGKVNQLKPAEFELYIRLILIVDDFGRFDGSAVRIARECWPSREDITSKTVDPLLVALVKVGLIIVYFDDKKRYIQMTNWSQRTRAEKSKYPPINADDGQMTVICQADDGHPRTSAHVDVDVDVDVDGKKTKQTFGEFSKVKLTDLEYQKLISKFGTVVAESKIASLDEYIASKGKRYSDHYATILSWSRKEQKESQPEKVVNKYPVII